MAEVQCRYCLAANDAEEHRCSRCGRRLHLAAPRPAPEPYPLISTPSASSSMTAAAAAPALESLPIRQRQSAIPEPDPQSHPGFQRSLFRESVGGPKVVPIPTLTSARPQAREAHSIRRAPSRPTTRPRRVADTHQQALEFADAEPVQAGLSPNVELIYCDAPVALPGHRLLAAAVDTSLVLIALGVFGIFLSLFLGGDFLLNRQAAPFLVGVGAVIALFYRSLWYFGNGDSPGMRFAGLRLVDFDGRRPSREQRVLRQAASLLSLLAAGLGLVWALVDEESLTWHDHISKTFPTPN